MNFKPAITAVLLGVCCDAMADVKTGSAEADAIGERLVHDFVTNVITLKGKFVQSLKNADGDIIDRTSGVLEIERPVRFRWTYNDPYEQWLVADGLNIWSYDVELAQVTVKPQAAALANTPALLLGGAENALEQFEFGGTTVEELTTWVRLEPIDKNSGFERVDLGFIDEQLRWMVFFDNLEQTTFVALHDVVVNEAIDPARFEFLVPDGVDVVGLPASARSVAADSPAR